MSTSMTSAPYTTMLASVKAALLSRLDPEAPTDENIERICREIVNQDLIEGTAYLSTWTALIQEKPDLFFFESPDVFLAHPTSANLLAYAVLEALVEEVDDWWAQVQEDEDGIREDGIREESSEEGE